MSQRELAEKVGVSRPTISQLENGAQSTMNTDTAKRLARALGVSVDYLINTWGEEDDEGEMSALVALALGGTWRRRSCGESKTAASLAPPSGAMAVWCTGSGD